MKLPQSRCYPNPACEKVPVIINKIMDFSYVNCLFQAINYKTQITRNVVELGHELFKIIKRDCTVGIPLFLEMAL